MPSPAAKHMLYWLVVHGSYGPGGSDHDQLSGLEGTWHAGSFSGVAGPSFSDLVVQRFGGEPVQSWALQIALKPPSPGDASDADGNTPVQLFDRWEHIDAMFATDAIRMDTTFHFESSHPIEGDVCRANTYGSLSMIPDGRYDAVRPDSTLAELWTQTLRGTKTYDPTVFQGLLTEIQPEQLPSLFVDVPGGDEFVERVGRVMQRPDNHATDAELLDLARHSVQRKSAMVLASDYRGAVDLAAAVQQLDFQIADSQVRPELGDMHYELVEGFAHACRYIDPEPWAVGLSEACFALTSSHDMVYWLTQTGRGLETDLQPIVDLWDAGGDVAIDIDGVAHVTVERAPDSA